MKRLLSAVLTAFLLLSLTACGEPAVPAPEEPDPTEEQPIPAPPPPTKEELEALQIQEILDGMTLEEQVGQLFFARCPAENAVEDVSTYHLGGYILFGRDYKDDAGNWLTWDQFTGTINSYQAAAKIPLLIGTDEEGGTVARASRNPNLFSRKARSPQQLEREGHEHGDRFLEDAWEKNGQLHSLGINVNLAPVADVSTDPADFIYDRTIGKDAEGTADYVRRVVTGMQDTGVGSVLKHFPGYGNNVDTHTGIAVDNRPLEQFRSSDFLPFLAGMEAGGRTTAVLVSHNIMTCVDGQLPASLSPAVHTLLREELGFSGVVMTDDLAMDAVAAYAGDGAVAVMAFAAGNDIILTSDYRTQIPKMVEAFQNGTLDPLKLQASCRRILEWKQALGLMEPVETTDEGPDF